MKNQHKQSIKKTAIAAKHKDSHNYDFVVLFFLIGYLLIDFMPYAQRMEIIKPQFLYLTVLNIIVTLYIYFNPSLFSSSLIAIFKKSYIFKAYLIFMLLAGLSVIGAKNITMSINAIAEIVVVFGMFVNFAILLHKRLHLIYKVAFIVGIVAFFQVLGSLTALKEFIFSNKSLTEAILSTKGNTGHKNILSASLMTKIPFLLVGITYFINWKRWFLMISLILSTSMVLILNARSALLSLFIIVVVYLIYHIRSHSIKKEHIIKASYFVIPIIISLIAINIFFFKADTNNSINKLHQINSDKTSTTERFIFWKTALGFVKEKPVFGIGLGNWRIESIPFENRKDKVLSLNAHNDFLEIAAESGILNGLIYFLIFAMLFVVNLKRTLKQKVTNSEPITVLPLLLLLVYGVDAFFNFPLYRPTMQLCFSFLMALTFVNGKEEEIKVLPSKTSRWILILSAVIPLYVTYYADRTSQLEYKIKSDNIDFNLIGRLNGDEIINQKPLFPNVFNTSESFEEYAGIYYFREKQYNQAIKHLDIGNTINPYLGRPNFYKYLMAAERGRMDSAYHYVKSSFYTYPSGLTLHNAYVEAQKYADTVEILKMYALNRKYEESSLSWSRTVMALQNSNYSSANLNRFLEQGILDFPNDSIARSTYNATKITAYIIAGQKLFAQGKQTEALKTYQTALKIDSTNVYAQQNIAFYYYNLGKMGDAIPYFLRALQKPGLFDGRTEYYLAISYLNIGKKEIACKYFNIALNRNYLEAKKALGQFCN